jgi:hypothetical protein
VRLEETKVVEAQLEPSSPNVRQRAGFDHDAAAISSSSGSLLTKPQNVESVVQMSNGCRTCQTSFDIRHSQKSVLNGIVQTVSNETKQDNGPSRHRCCSRTWATSERSIAINYLSNRSSMDSWDNGGWGAASSCMHKPSFGLVVPHVATVYKFNLGWLEFSWGAADPALFHTLESASALIH